MTRRVQNCKNNKKDKYHFTRDKVKEEFNNMKFMLHDIVKNYELSGNGGGQRNEEDDDWGSSGLIGTELVDGDDRSNFLTLGGKKPDMEKNWYLLYYWHRLDEEGLVQFALSKLPKFMSANSNHFENVTSPKKKKHKSELTEAIGGVGKGIQNFASTINASHMDKKEVELYNLKMELADPTKPDWQKPLLKERITKLEADIKAFTSA